MTAVPVLEIGGTHVSAALVEPGAWTVHAARRFTVDADAPAATLIRAFRTAADAITAPPGAVWGVAMPDPFDYERGIGRFEGVGKFGALHGVDVRSALFPALGRCVFVNDADAFVLGEWTAGAGRGAARCVGMTLGTGVGSGWLVDGVVTDPGQPPGGRIHRLSIDGAPLEDVVSRRAVRRAFVVAGGDPGADVREIAVAARAGDVRARRVLDDAFTALGAVVGRCLRGFGADVLVVGGSTAASWDLLEPAFRHGAGRLPDVRVARDSDAAPMVGAAAYARRARD